MIGLTLTGTVAYGIANITDKEGAGQRIMDQDRH
jgi:hypothetical protein